MATADVDICNRALLRIGQKEPIASLGEATTQAIQCSVLYPQCRDEVLCSAPWPFAVKHQVLADTGLTRTGWAHMYSAPADMLMPRYISNGQRPGANLVSSVPSAVIDYMVRDWSAPPIVGILQDIPFTVEASDDGTKRWILTDQPGAELIYTFAATAVPLFPPLFVDTLAWKMAEELALALPVKAPAADNAHKKYLECLSKALAAEWRGTREDRPQDAKAVSRRG